ncbi:hypothetical protein SDC9_205000 [bioreactor metagenome]|uniref:Non-specific protein-tyrosine kinase n=1 Tax=bioreactor metagenome TaxID=1076179 RepID=A0A645J1H8_9ZZZZ
MLLTSYGETEKEALMEGKSLLAKVNSNILGVVLNKIPEGGKGSYYNQYYSHGYGNQYGDDDEATDNEAI